MPSTGKHFAHSSRKLSADTKTKGSERSGLSRADKNCETPARRLLQSYEAKKSSSKYPTSNYSISDQDIHVDFSITFAVEFVDWLREHYAFSGDERSRDALFKAMFIEYKLLREKGRSHTEAWTEMQAWAIAKIPTYSTEEEPPRSHPPDTTSACSYRPNTLRSDCTHVEGTYAKVKQWEYGKTKAFQYQDLGGYELVHDPHGTFADGCKRPGYREYKPKSAANSTRDLYAILGVSPIAMQAEIKKAYFRLAKRFHPDKGKDVDKAEFQDISAAYDVLGDEDTKEYYDSTGLVPPARPPPDY